jgi:hypothetical protein
LERVKKREKSKNKIAVYRRLYEEEERTVNPLSTSNFYLV